MDMMIGLEVLQYIKMDNFLFQEAQTKQLKFGVL